MNTRLLRVQILHKIVIYATADEAVAYMFYRRFFLFFVFFLVFLFFFRPQKI